MGSTPDSVMVKVEFDDEAKVWVATSEDVPGLVAEHADFQSLIDIVGELIPILLEENGMLEDNFEPFDIPVCIAASAMTKRHVKLAA
jgi:hypothetical protein